MENVICHLRKYCSQLTVLYSNQTRLLFAEYEDSEYFSTDAPRSLYPSRSLSALHTDRESNNQSQNGELLTKDGVLKLNTKIIVTNDFEATVDDEISVKKGDTVTALYRDQNWVYIVKDEDGEEGFIPQMYCSTRINGQKKDIHGSKAETNGRSKSSNKFRFGSGRSRSLGRKSKVQQRAIGKFAFFFFFYRIF